MYADFFAGLSRSPLLALPLVALFLFLGVFCVATARALTQGKLQVARAAALPFDDEDDHG